MNQTLVFTGAAKSHGGRFTLPRTDFTLAPGELLAVTGPSGAGKSTLLRLAAGLIRPDTGEVRVNARRIGFVFQEPRLLPWLTALDNTALPLRVLGLTRVQARDRARAELEALGLAAALAVHPGRLSGGMRQRVNLARALAIEPDLLLLDEPFTGLDDDLKAEVRGLVAAYLTRSGAAAVLVTHDRRDIPEGAVRELRLTPSPA